jgi:hypothetical protein
MNRIAFAILLIAATLQAQDVVKLTNGAELDVSIIGNNEQTISFLRGVEGAPAYYIAKDEIAQILYQNGTIEQPEHPEKTRADRKNELVSVFNACAQDKDQHALNGTFEGDYLRITSVDGKGDFSKGKLFEIAKAKPEETSYRVSGIAFLNIRTFIKFDEKRNNWKEFKLVLRVENHEQAALLTNAFKQLKNSLKAKR